jgi:uncharacterized protein
MTWDDGLSSRTKDFVRRGMAMDTQATRVAPRAFLLLGQAGEKQFHNQPDHWALLAEIMRAASLSSRVISDDLADLNPANLARFDVLLNFSTDLEASDEQMGALLDEVRGGTGFVGLHAATATFRSSQAYHGMIGSWFGRHDPIKTFRVEITEPDHPVTAGVSAFEIEDELYELKDVVADIHVLAHAEGHPMVYTRQYGLGRVCYIAPGHDRRSLGRPEYAQLVDQAIRWVARPSP